MRDTVVLYPGVGIGHFIPMMELADVFLKHGYAVTVALISHPDISPDFAATIGRFVSSNPSIFFHTLPSIPDPPSITYDEHFMLMYLELIRRYNEHLRDLICSIPVQRIYALVVDMLSIDAALDVAKMLGVPIYTFFPSNAAALAVSLQFAPFRADNKPNFKELGDTPVEFFGVPPIPASHLPREMLEDAYSEIYKAMVKLCRMTESNGILVNTFELLQTWTVRALREPNFLPGLVLPPVYSVGPLVKNSERNRGSMRHECLAWLDAQPDRSVVFLCFGSAGVHSEEQLKEMAVGLEKSGHRFLWVLRAPYSKDPEPDLDALLPEGFLERTKDRGLVVKSWAPQVDVLRHSATGAFVTHCGWNSVLESITAGVPMLCWPLYAEQKMNKVFMVEEMRVGLEIEGYNDGLVKAEEVEDKIRLVMESEEGKELRERVMAHKEGAAMALTDGGSSQADFLRFLSDVEKLGHARGLAA